MPRVIPLCVVVIAAVLANIASWANSQETGREKPAVDLTPLLVCPPRFSTPIVVPAADVLRDAERLQPVSEEGWIIQHRPVANCVNHVGDAESRAAVWFELPMKMHRYESQIRVAEAELQSWRRRLENYRYFNKTGALMVTVENTELAILAAEERLRDLLYERQLFVRLVHLERELQRGVAVPLPAAANSAVK